jgi:DNA repair exonuclease SbcCD nuclease subunit
MLDLVIAHSSDLHLDVVPHRTGGPSEAADLLPLTQVIDAARAAEAHLLLLVGDVFDHNRVGLPFVDRVAGLLAEAGRPIVLLPGNHDPLTSDSVYYRGGLADLPNVHIIGISDPEAVRFPDLDLEVWGRAHRDYGDMTPLDQPRRRTTRWQVAMAHGHVVTRSTELGRWRASWLILPEQIAASGADYLALGHWNRPACVTSGTVPAYYSGSPDVAGTLNLVHLRPGIAARVSRWPVAASGGLAAAG